MEALGDESGTAAAGNRRRRGGGTASGCGGTRAGQQGLEQRVEATATRTVKRAEGDRESKRACEKGESGPVS